MKALVLSGGGHWAAWEAGAWSVLADHFQPDLIVGASAGAWNGWAIAGGCPPGELLRFWLDPAFADILKPRLSPVSVFDPALLHARARDLAGRYTPRTAFALTIVELPRMVCKVVRGQDVTAAHLAATGAIPLAFPPVKIEGRRYVDGGFRGGLPLAAAASLGATQVLGLNVLNTPLFRFLHRTIGARRDPPALNVVRLEPSERLGSLRDSVRWREANVARWIELGRLDAIRALTSDTMEHLCRTTASSA
jgi:predicted acylesterase/phospholipase RssA